MRRGDLVTVALQKPYGKPRPALVIQSDLFSQHPSVTLLPVTGEVREAPLFRLIVEPTPENGLLKSSQVMVDKAVTVPRETVGEVIGRLDNAALAGVNQALALFLGLA